MCCVAYECDFTPDQIAATPGAGIWRWSGALPVDLRQAVSLGEGNTPLLSPPRVARDVGVTTLYVKNEAANPTGSHKDRLAAVAIAAARQIGAEVVTGASTGNHGAASRRTARTPVPPFSAGSIDRPSASRGLR